VPINCREGGHVGTTFVLLWDAGSAKTKKKPFYLRHVGDVFLNVLVRGCLLLHLVSQSGQRLEQGIGLPLGLVNVNETHAA